MENEIKQIKESVDIIAKTTASILDNMATKQELMEVKEELHDFRTEMKSFKNDTGDSIEKIDKEIADLEDTALLNDKRIEKLENKIFV
ncbi:MAG: hypothetical protein WDK96_03355 [Candidatus Paceibacterota bacterium]|jgi:predicted RNase H-like nuclease (RuvC/YqgF family)